MSDEIPLIDFGRFRNGNRQDRLDIAKQIGKACREIGFFYISNHGIGESTIENVYEQARIYFDQSIEEKMKLFIGSCPYENNRGYTPIHEEKLSLKGDLKEGFDLALELPADDHDRIVNHAQLYGPNVWPENLPDFRRIIYDEFYLKMLDLSKEIFESFALALDLDENYFKGMLNKPMVTMRLLSYPPQPIVEDEDELGCGAHTDYECFTLLSQSNQQGLQILNKNQVWIDAKPIPNTFVVNIGDLMQRWTNDLFQSTIHRVINVSGQQRYSIPVFFGPNYFTRIETILKSNQQTKYEPILAGDYLISRFDQTYQYRQQK